MPSPIQKTQLSLSQNCDGSLFWDGFEYHVNGTVSCSEGDVFDTTGENVGCSIGGCRLLLDEGARVTFLNGSSLRLGHSVIQTSPNTSLVFDGDVACVFRCYDIEVRGNVSVRNHPHGESILAFDFWVESSGYLELKNNTITGPSCPCIYPVGGRIVIESNSFYDSSWIIYRSSFRTAVSDIYILNSYVGPASDSVVEVSGQNVRIQNVSVYNTDDSFGQDIFVFYDSNVTLSTVNFQSSRTYSTADILGINSKILADGIRNPNFNYTHGDPTETTDCFDSPPEGWAGTLCPTRFFIMGTYIEFNPNNYIIAEIEGPGTCPADSKGTFKLFLERDRSNPSHPVVEVIEPCTRSVPSFTAITDPSINRIPFRFVMEPLSSPPPDAWDVNNLVRVTLFDISPRLLDVLMELSHLAPDIPLATFIIALKDRDQDGVLERWEVVENLLDEIPSTVVEMLVKNYLRDYSLTLLLIGGAGISLASMIPKIGTTLPSATSSLASVAMVLTPTFVIDPCYFLFYGFFQQMWTPHGASMCMGGAENLPFTVALSKVDLELRDSAGRIINKTLNQIPGSEYQEIELTGDNEVDDLITLPSFSSGDYSVRVLPEQSAMPADTFSLYVGVEGVGVPLVRDAPISSIPDSGYTFSLDQVPESANVTFYIDPPVSGASITFNGAIYADGERGNYAYGNYTAIAGQPATCYFRYWTSTGGVRPLSNASTTTASIAGSGSLAAAFNCPVPVMTSITIMFIALPLPVITVSRRSMARLRT